MSEWSIGMLGLRLFVLIKFTCDPESMRKELTSFSISDDKSMAASASVVFKWTVATLTVGAFLSLELSWLDAWVLGRSDSRPEIPERQIRFPNC